MTVAAPPRPKVLGTTWVPADDPVPWVTERMRKAGAFAKPDPLGLFPAHAVVALLDILTETVSALHDDAKPYRVILSQHSASAATALNAKLVEIGSKPWRDRDLTDGQKAAIMVGLALHEVGHIRFAQNNTRALNAQFGSANVTPAIMTLSNLASDHHDERAARDLFPGLSDAIRPVMWWVGDKGMRSYDWRDVDAKLNESIAERVNLAIAATRYPWQCEWTSGDGRTWLAWWADWAKRATLTRRPKDHALIVQEAIDKVRAFTPTHTPPPQPPQPPGPCPPEGPTQPPRGDEPPPPPPPEPPKGEGRDGRGNPVPPGDDPGGEPGEKPEGKEPTPPSGEEPDITVRQGSLGNAEPDPSATFDDREDGAMDDPCSTDKTKEVKVDAVLQSSYERAQRGTREGMRTRRYVHQASHWGKGDVPDGRVVASIPRRGGRWVNDHS